MMCSDVSSGRKIIERNKQIVGWSQAAHAQYGSLITCGLVLRNPQKGREDKGFVWEFRY